MKRKDGHVQLGLTVFFTVSAILLLYDTFFGSRVLQSFGRQFLSALSPVLYGAFMAYLLAPMVNYFEELFLPKGKKIEKGKRTSGGLRALSILLTWAIIAVMLYLLASVLLPELYKSIAQLLSNIETYYHTISGWVAHLLETYPPLEHWVSQQLDLSYNSLMNWITKEVLPQASTLMTIVSGSVFGMVSFADVGTAAWFSLPRFLHFGVTFDAASCIAIGLLFAINSIQAIGDFTATTVGGMDRDPTDQELQGGIIAYGVSNILAALFGGLPTATYSQNVGIVTTNKVVNRTVFAFAGGFLLLAGVSPKFAALLTTIPQCVLGGATVTVFSTIAMTGMKLIASQDLTARNTTIVGLSAALGVGISQASAALSQFPAAVTMIFGKSPVVIATLMAVLLNLILPKEKS